MIEDELFTWSKVEYLDLSVMTSSRCALNSRRDAWRKPQDSHSPETHTQTSPYPTGTDPQSICIYKHALPQTWTHTQLSPATHSNETHCRDVYNGKYEQLSEMKTHPHSKQLNWSNAVNREWSGTNQEKRNHEAGEITFKVNNTQIKLLEAIWLIRATKVLGNCSLSRYKLFRLSLIQLQSSYLQNTIN